MRTSLIKAIIVTFSFALPVEAYESWGSIRVEPNIANPEFPSHYITINRGEAGRFGPSYLRIRCENNKTEVYLSVDGVYGYRGRTRVKWAGMSRAQRIGAVESSDGQAAFFNNSIGFLTRFVDEGTVVLEVEGYNVRGAARYTLNNELIDGIYALANTCQWTSRLPKREALVKNSDQAERAMIQAMIPKIEEIGKLRFLELLDELLPN